MKIDMPTSYLISIIFCESYKNTQTKGNGVGGRAIKTIS